MSVNDLKELSITELENKIFDYSGKTFNVGSPKQLGEILFDEMKIEGGKHCLARCFVGLGSSFGVLKVHAYSCSRCGSPI